MTYDHLDKEEDIINLIEQYIDEVFTDLSGYVQYEDGQRENAESNNIYLTYGEITFKSLIQLTAYLDLDENDVFADLGSGIGKVCLQVFLTTKISKAYGIEAMKDRHLQAKEMLKEVKTDLPQHFVDGRDIIFKNSNFLAADFKDVTFIYMCSTCYSDELLEKIGEIVASHPNIRYLLSLKEVPCSLPLLKKTEIECSWGESTCYIYARNNN